MKGGGDELFGGVGQQLGTPAGLGDEDPKQLALAVELTPDDSLDLPLYLVRLGICLEDTAKPDKDLAGLDRAIDAYGKAVQSTQPGTQQLPRNLSRLRRRRIFTR